MPMEFSPKLLIAAPIVLLACALLGSIALGKRAGLVPLALWGVAFT
jgi:hypothetical protein